MTTETTGSTELKIEVEEPAKWARRLTITVPARRVEQERGAVAKNLAKRLNLPGFRKGKVPPQIIEKRFGPAIDNELIERLVGDAYKEALAKEGFTPISQAEVDSVAYEPGTDLTFNVGFEIRPEIELERVGGFTVVRPKPQVGDEEVDKVLTRLREEHAVWQPVDAQTPVSGDMVSVEITALDEEGEAAQPRPYRFVLGEGQAVNDVEDAIRTLNPGQGGEFTLTLGAEGEEAKQRRLRIELIEAKRPELPALDDEFARTVGEFESIEDLRARVLEDLQREAGVESERTVRQALVDAVVEANPIEVPAGMVGQYLERALPERDGADGERLAEARELARPAAEVALRRLLVIERIAQMENLRATQTDVDQRIEEMAERWGRPVNEVWAQLQKSGRLQMMEEEITEDKVFDYLKSQSSVIEE